MGSSSLTRNWIWAPCIGTEESKPLDHQGNPYFSFYIDVSWAWAIYLPNSSMGRGGRNDLTLQYSLTQFFFLNYINLFTFYWRTIVLQDFVVFCQTSTWISHKYTYTPSLLNLPPISLPIPPLWVDTESLFEFPGPYSKFLLAI